MGRQHQGMDRPGVHQVQEGSGEQRKMEKTGCKIICGAPTTLAVKELMMMMMMIGVCSVFLCVCVGGGCKGAHRLDVSLNSVLKIVWQLLMLK